MRADGRASVVRHVDVKRRGRGIEAAARELRYAALADAAREAGARIVMTAITRRRSSQTFLLQWMRGAGPTGWRHLRQLGVLATICNCCVHLVDIARTDVERYVALRALSYVDDDSNDDVALLRNVVRRDVLPRIDGTSALDFAPPQHAQSTWSLKRLKRCVRWLRTTTPRAPTVLQEECCGLIVWSNCPLRGRPECCERGWRDRACRRLAGALARSTRSSAQRAQRCQAAGAIG